MGMSVAILSTIILFLIVFHAVALSAYHFHRLKQLQLQQQQQQGNQGTKFTMGEKGQKILHWILVTLMPVSWIMSIVATASCTFLTVLIENPLNPQEDLEWGLGFSRMFLPLKLASTFGQNGGCEALDTDTGNISLVLSNSAAKIFASFNCVLTTVGFFLSTALTLKLTMLERRDFAWLIMRISMYISMFCCIFTFYLRESEICNVQPCSLGNHGILQVVNVIFLLIICIILFLVGPGNTPYIRQCYVSAQQVYDRNVAKGRKDPEFPSRT